MKAAWIQKVPEPDADWADDPDPHVLEDGLDEERLAGISEVRQAGVRVGDHALELVAQRRGVDFGLARR